MTHDSVNKRARQLPVPTQQQVVSYVTEQTQAVVPAGRGRGKPATLTALHLCLGIVLSGLEGFGSQLKLWRRLCLEQMGPFAPVHVVDQAVYNRLERAAGAMRAFFEQVSGWMSAQVVGLEDRRWDIELAYGVLKEHLHVSQLRSAKWAVVQVQIWCALLLAQLFHGLQVQLAAQQGVEPLDVSLELLVELVPRLLQRGIAPLPYLGQLGREVGLIRPSTRLRVEVPLVDPGWITPAPPGALRPRDSARYAQRNCGRGPRPKTKKAG